MTALQKILKTFREASVTEREKGTYFEELIITYLKYEATYKDLYSDVWMFSDWAHEQGIDGKDTGIDLVAKTSGTNEYHAIQCKFYADDYRIQKGDIDSFFTASGKKQFSHRVIVTTTNNWSSNAEDALRDQQPPVTKIDLHDLENSQIDWVSFQPTKEPNLKTKHGLRPHQQNAITQVIDKFNNVDRGKMIMACGTGKTFTSLKIAEEQAGAGKRVLFLVPSLSLLSQTLTEWTQQSQIPLHSFAVCSDSDIGKKRKKDDDIVQTFTHELRYPATTNAASLATEMKKRHDANHMSVVFSTYHSISVISEAQQEYGLEDFDLIICDEAHRTTGATFEGEAESKFVRVHDNDFLKASKRLYMTATPRIYGDGAKVTAIKDNTALYSMDDEIVFGKELYVITFSEAVTRKLLVDYKVIVLTVDADHISSRLQRLLAGEDNDLKVDDAAKIIGCWKALSKQDQNDDLSDDANPMKRALAFCQVIEPSTGKKTHKVSSKNIAGMFQEVVEAYQEQEDDHNSLICEAEHVDGSMNATEKEVKLSWLKEETEDDTCRILSNVRCLSEGVDVPALDAVLFLTPRNSQVDVVQSVGRIMRIAPNKTRGYVILPVVIPTGVKPHEALNDNKTYKVVWEVLQALRSHDDRFDAHINKLDLIGKDNSKMEVIAITDKIQKKAKKNSSKGNSAKGGHIIGTSDKKHTTEEQFDMQFEVGEIERALYAKVVQKCGNRNHWEDWANDIAKIATTHITRIKTIVENPDNIKEVAAFTAFADELRDDLNDNITNDEVVEMLAQHLITKPVFDALFEEYSFASNNPVSIAMQNVLDVLQEHSLHKEADTLEKFYTSVKLRAEGIKSAEGKQKIVLELYDKFFKKAFPKMTDRLGIVYTPVEVVDFIIHSVNDVLKSEFGQTLGSKGVHIIDPFTGTGTFITRLMQSGLISKDQLPNKYKNEIHANEIVLLAYYIAAINIEAAYHSIVGGEYVPFEGICLTDTFQLYEKDDMISGLLVDNSARRMKQKELNIRVIMGNPPYKGQQKDAGDNNASVVYPNLDESIRSTYAEQTNVTNKNSLYNSFIRAFRWGSDRLGDSGVLAYVSSASFIESQTAGGLRKCLAEEYSNLHVFNLRGDARTSGELRRKEGGNVFDEGSREPIAITIAVKNINTKKAGEIFYYDIGDYLTPEDKLKSIADLKSIDGLNTVDGWQVIVPDKHNDWINQRDNSFDRFISIGDKKDKSQKTIFENYSRGVATSRDPWCQNTSNKTLKENMTSFITFYNEETEKFRQTKPQGKKSELIKLATSFVNKDPIKISWSDTLYNSVASLRFASFEEPAITNSLYRPFSKQWLYYSKIFNERTYQMTKIFPPEILNNKVIIITGVGAKNGFSTLISDTLPDLNIMAAGSQCFPLKLYEMTDESTELNLFSSQKTQNGYNIKDGLTDDVLELFRAAYHDETITKENIFYYIYGVLHSPDYRNKYADNLSKQLPRIPCLKTFKDFRLFVDAGQKLGALHLNYESVECYPIKMEGAPQTDKHYYVTKMRFGKSARDKDKTIVIYNDHITIKNIPLEAYDYIVNGKSALEWVMDRQIVKTDKASGIVNDANLYATETMNNAKYPLELFLRVITVSIETMKIVNSLPPLDIDTDKK